MIEDQPGANFTMEALGLLKMSVKRELTVS